MPDNADRGPTPVEIAEFLTAIPLDRVPAAIAVLAARLLAVPKPDSAPIGERYLSPDEITDRYGIDRRWVYAHAEQLGAVKLGRRTMRVPESGLKRYLDAHRVAEAWGPR